jgi:hypothetical protein
MVGSAVKSLRQKRDSFHTPVKRIAFPQVLVSQSVAPSKTIRFIHFTLPPFARRETNPQG